jgi:carboxypeptidase T
MRYIILITCFLAQITIGYAQQQYARVRVHLDGKNITELARLGIEADHGDCQPGLYLTTDLSDDEIILVKNAGFRTEILIPDVSNWYAKQLTEGQQRLVAERNNGASCGSGTPININSYPTPINYTYGSMGGYHTYAEMLAVLDSMHAKFPNLITSRAVITDTLLTHEGRPLYWVKISDNPNTDDATEPEMLYTALHHAREPNGLSQMIFYMWYLLENYNNLPEIQHLLNNTELYFVPCINPDGYIFNELTNPQGGGLWRKNRRDNGGNVFGVDLNRNYGYFWGDTDEGSSPNPQSGTYRGPSAFSEPETRLMRLFCEQHEFKFALNYHTFSNLMLYPWGYNDQLADPAFDAYATLFTKENRYKKGTAIQTVGYRVNGVSDDWMFANDDIFAFTPEVGPPAFGFWPPADTIDGLNKAAMWGNLSPALSLLNLGIATDLSAPEIFADNYQLPIEAKRYGLQSGPFIVTLFPLDNAATISPSSQAVNIGYLDGLNLSYGVQMNNNLQPGDIVRFIISVDNGTYILNDTIEKIYWGVPRTVIYSDNFDSNANWTGDWQLTNELSYSPTTCMTDSPNDVYQPNTFSVHELIAPIVIPDSILSPQLRFWARWGLETGYDWLQIEAQDAVTGAIDYLCGRYTAINASNDLPQNIPLYTGVQNDWVQECIDLSAFKGRSVLFKWVLFTDPAVNLDGFFLDDVEFNFIDTATSSVHFIPNNNTIVEAIQPNPSHIRCTLKWDPAAFPTDHAVLLEVTDGLGRIQFQRTEKNTTGAIYIDTQNWPNGVYSCQLSAATGIINTQKLVVQHPR